MFDGLCSIHLKTCSPHQALLIVIRRLEYKPHLIRWEEIKDESVTGKQMIYFVTDKAGRPIVLMRPRSVTSSNHTSHASSALAHPGAALDF